MNRRTFVAAGAALGASGLASTAAVARTLRAGAAPDTLPGRSHTQIYFMAAPLEVTWRAFTSDAERKVWWGVPGGNPIATAAEVRAPHLIHSKIDHPGLPGPTETLIKFETVEGGTRITHISGGYGNTPVWQNSLESSADGIDEMMSDLALYLRTGTGFPRHTGAGWPKRAPHPNDLRTGTRNTPGGVEVMEVRPGTLAAEAGIQPGDTLVALGDAGIYTMRDLRLANLMHAPGDVVELTWVRGKQVMKGKGRMVAAPIQWRDGRDPTKGR